MAESRNILVSIIFRVAVCAVLMLTALAIYIFLVSTASKPATSDTGAAIPRVEVMRAQAVPVQRQWEGFGTAAAMEEANVPARVTATVIEKPEKIRPGQPVDLGQLLVRLDESDFQKQVEMSSQQINDLDAQLSRLAVEEHSWTKRAELAAEEVRLAQLEYDRIKGALEREAAREREVDQVKRALVAAQHAEVATREELDKIVPRRAGLMAQRGREEANLKLARIDAERCKIVSPLNGVIAEVDVEVGENLTIGQRVARVVSMTRIEVPLLLPASARSFIAPGDSVELSDAGASSRTWIASVTRISPIDDESTRTMRVYAEVNQPANDSGLLPPGRFVRGVVRSGVAESRWIVPRRALTGERVLTIRDGHVASRAVEIDFNVQAEFPMLGLVDQHWVVLQHPLPAGSLIVVDGSRSLAEGAAVDPIVAQRASVPVDHDGASAPSVNTDREPSGATVLDGRPSAGSGSP